jgi:hypothetical protein
VAVKVGLRLRAQNSPCEVMVVKGSDADGVLACGGLAMSADAPAGDAEAPAGPPIKLGKRYSDEGSGIEVLCTKQGIGPLTFADRELTLLSAKPLPASD